MNLIQTNSDNTPTDYELVMQLGADLVGALQIVGAVVAGCFVLFVSAGYGAHYWPYLVRLMS
jgi:hypothetical protein